MKLQKFDYQIKDNRKNKSFIILGLLLVALVVGVVLYKTFAVYTSEDSYNIIKGTVGEFTIEPLKITYNLVGEDGGIMSTSELPSSTEYEFDQDSSSCVNGNEIDYSNNTVTIGDGSEGLEDTCNLYFNYIPLSKQTLYALGYTSADIKSGIPYGPDGTGETGFYAAEDDYGTSYYYYSSDSDGPWTIPAFSLGEGWFYLIRINGNGSIRIMSGEDINLFKYNLNNDDNMYVGYMYGTTDNPFDNINNSNIKKDFDNYGPNIDWNYFDDVIFCNDRSLYKDDYGTKESDDLATGKGTDITYYGSYYRIRNNTPSLKCPNKNDAFTKDDEEYGNGKLEYPMGLITADEAYMINPTWFNDAFSGDVYTMSPAYFKDGKAQIYSVGSSTINSTDVITSNALSYRVLNIKYGFTYKGDGVNELFEIVE